MRPAPLLLWLLFGWLLFAICTSIFPRLLMLWAIMGGMLLIIALYDLLQLWMQTFPHVTRKAAGSLALGVWCDVELTIFSRYKADQQIEIIDDYPPQADIENLPQTLYLQANTGVATQYQFCPQQRGNLHFNGVHLLLHSSLHLWKRYYYQAIPQAIKVYPNFAAVTKYALFAIENRLGQLGIRKRPRRGEGLEFHQLREYRAGDSLRQINWNATSRLKKLISKEYQDERDQQIIFLIDCGRRMATQDGALSHFDHTLNAVLLLSYVALRQGDALGLLTFSGTESRWIAPRKGMNTVNLVLNTLYDLQPTLRTSDYLNAVEQLLKHHQKRALIILISNLRDEDNEELTIALKLLRAKHLVLLASLREKILNEVLDAPVMQFNDALRYAAIHEYLGHRSQSQENFKNKGVIFVDTEPEQLAIHIVNRYLDIKRGGIL
ncbi:DUF58 domain-containing protein [Beggiatoa leptomitoformis]|uniref:DUF58 domain-containing protein n=1 Tax=Beggiatoa leptomitoformis TaxID=288004 RepID=A0A2N9YHR4_9GAMM|nr:DUF58 domain-containing protein [Beggiatoa leptomitoformis]ALG67689.1 DUF58 domain-containing protein [Beggiatoa leptomitoformis]AUI70072.1 DUF58 domain-containing protein [Beggiatoa leptomitoformis]